MFTREASAPSRAWRQKLPTSRTVQDPDCNRRVEASGDPHPASLHCLFIGGSIATLSVPTTHHTPWTSPWHLLFGVIHRVQLHLHLLAAKPA